MPQMEELVEGVPFQISWLFFAKHLCYGAANAVDKNLCFNLEAGYQ